MERLPLIQRGKGKLRRSSTAQPRLLSLEEDIKFTKSDDFRDKNIDSVKKLDKEVQVDLIEGSIDNKEDIDQDGKSGNLENELSKVKLIDDDNDDEEEEEEILGIEIGIQNVAEFKNVGVETTKIEKLEVEKNELERTDFPCVIYGLEEDKSNKNLNFFENEEFPFYLSKVSKCIKNLQDRFRLKVGCPNIDKYLEKASDLWKEVNPKTQKISLFQSESLVYCLFLLSSEGILDTEKHKNHQEGEEKLSKDHQSCLGLDSGWKIFDAEETSLPPTKTPILTVSKYFEDIHPAKIKPERIIDLKTIEISYGEFNFEHKKSPLSSQTKIMPVLCIDKEI